MTLIWKGLRAVWGTVLCIWMQLAWAVLMVVGLLMPIEIAEGRGYGVAVLVFVTISLVAYSFSHHVALMPRTRKITQDQNPYLYAVAYEQAQLAGLPMPEVIESLNYTASAIGGRRRHVILAVSPDLQETLNRQELGAILAHEIAHLKYGDSLVMTVVMMFIGSILGASLLLGFSGWIGAIVLLLPLMAWPREFRADSTAANVRGDSDALVSALIKLDGGSLRSSLSLSFTHPPTKLRVWRLKGLAIRSV